MRAIVLTPNIDGADGISTLSRLVVNAFGPETSRIVTLNEKSRSDGGFHRVDCDGRARRFVAAALAEIARSGDETLVVSVHLHLAPALLGFKLRTARTVTMLCGIEAWRPLSWPQAAALRWSDTLIAISEFTSRRFRETHPAFGSNDIAVCHPGIAADTAAILPARPELTRPVALIVGRMASAERYKGHDVLIDVWPEVRRVVPDAVLRIVGEGDDLPRLEHKAAALMASGAVEFAGRVPDEAISDEYARARAFVMPSTGEGFGFVFLESMRAGRACVGCNGAAAEIIDDGATGFVLPDPSPHRVAAAVIRLLSDPALAARMGAEGRRRFERQFTDTSFRTRLLATLSCAGAAS